MMTKKRCLHCRFFEPNDEGLYEFAGVKKKPGTPAALGECRHHAPRPNGSGRESVFWPPVWADDWCGQFEAEDDDTRRHP